MSDLLGKRIPKLVDRVVRATALLPEFVPTVSFSSSYPKRGSDDRHTHDRGKANEPPSMAEPRTPLSLIVRADLMSSR